MVEHINLFDPVQLHEYGGIYLEGESYRIRYQLSKRLFFKSVYIPFGPDTPTLEGFKDFLDYLNSKSFTKVKIDLPLILNKEIRDTILNLLKINGFKNSHYLQDEETIIVSPENFKLSNRNMRYVRSGSRDFNIIVKKELSPEELDYCYEIYKESANKIGFDPKSREVFNRINKESINSLAISKLDEKICGFLMGYQMDIINQESKKARMVRLLFTAVNEKGRESKVGFALHHSLFEKGFNELDIKLFDFHGASRSKNRTYVEFKRSFGGEFYDLPGSFIRTKFI